MAYLDLIIIIALIIIVLAFFRDFKTFLYLLGIVEVSLRLLRFVAANIGISSISGFIYDNFPANLFSVIDKYSSGIINIILNWVLAACFFMWLVCLVKYFFKKRK